MVWAGMAVLLGTPLFLSGALQSSRPGLPNTTSDDTFLDSCRLGCMSRLPCFVLVVPKLTHHTHLFLRLESNRRRFRTFFWAFLLAVAFLGWGAPGEEKIPSGSRRNGISLPLLWAHRCTHDARRERGRQSDVTRHRTCSGGARNRWPCCAVYLMWSPLFFQQMSTMSAVCVQSAKKIFLGGLL